MIIGASISQYKSHCCGCGACAAICPVLAITLKRNRNGFLYPTIDDKKCIGCGKCAKYCAFNASNTGNQLQLSYAVKHTDETVRENSRSGGIFTSLSDLILDRDGAVYGCKLDGCTKAVHGRAATKAERDAFRGSKYIQSETHEVFAAVKQDLQNGLWVLFSGTPCQVGAVQRFCADVNSDKLLLVDIVCHGVPSPLVWADYLDYCAKSNKKKVLSVDFRDKKRFGWAAHEETVVFEDQSTVSGHIFRKLFYDHLILRKDCFSCPYRSLERVGDITIADCWGIRQHYPDFDDDRGVSLVLVNSDKGREFFSKAKDISVLPVEIDKLMQPALQENWEYPSAYDEFWKYYHTHPFWFVVNKYVSQLPSQNLIIRILRRGKAIIRRAINYLRT